MSGLRPAVSGTSWDRRLRARPLLTSLVLEVLVWVVTIGGAFLLATLVPGLPGYSVAGPSASLLLVVVLAVLAVGLVAVMRWWGLAGFTRVREWRNLRLYWLPIVLLGVPFVAGIRIPPLGALAVLVLAYVATAVFEETMWRGMMLGLLRPRGVWPAVLISSVLFGLGHLGNSALRGFSVLILLQAFGAAVQGVGLAALRLRTNTIWPVIAIHALHDLTLQMGNLPVAAVDAPIDTVYLIYGIVLLRRSKREELQTPPTADLPSVSSERRPGA